MPKGLSSLTGLNASLAVEAGQQILEHLERPGFAVHRIGLAKGIADARMDGRRRYLHETP